LVVRRRGGGVPPLPVLVRHDFHHPLHDFLLTGRWVDIPYVPAPPGAVGPPLAPEAYRRHRWRAGERLRRINELGGACAWCRTRERLQLDPVIPVRFGGGSDNANPQVLCNACKQLKRGLDE